MPSALPLDPPQRLVRALGSLRGYAGEEVEAEADAWLAALPRLLEETLKRWELTAERVVAPGGRGSLVALVRQPDGAPAVLKLLAPDLAGSRLRAEREGAALAQWDGWGAVRLLRSAPEDGALLLERLHGEMSLRSLPEAKAMLEAVSAARRLWVTPAPEPAGGEGVFETVAEHTAEEIGFLRGAVPEEVLPLLEEALQLRAALLAEPPEQVLLHGDFRQGAVLAADAERARWLAVGPEPLLGERAYDLARLTRDRLHDLVASPGAAAATRRRIHKLADSLDVDRERLRGWSLYRAVESGIRHMASGRREDGEILLEFAGWL
ncbi:aminoglycoside phosphotransferase family protein [Streptomyces sp. HNM0574]|uniref:aminoglycoside phosphotransferase family protein n=1 Tax=Streptomyces sp. HNM0574 TaxID=2714954 RepID=UPI001469EE17|nr:aminoglycoside phosphotransferase family protein [Streptomyces sp. HNM0574]NLU69700.1 kinase [Streptomyces sp. HNM0574]